jgi:hypothetical protein
LRLASGRAKDERDLTQVPSRVPPDPALLCSAYPFAPLRPTAMDESAYIAGLAVQDSHRLESPRSLRSSASPTGSLRSASLGYSLAAGQFFAPSTPIVGRNGRSGGSIYYCFPAPFHEGRTFRLGPVAAFSIRLGLHPDRVALRSFRNFQAALPQTFVAGQGSSSPDKGFPWYGGI